MELSKQLQEQKKKLRIPEHDEAMHWVKRKEANALETFVYEHEPAGAELSETFRTQLLNVIQETATAYITKCEELKEFLKEILERLEVTNPEDIRYTDQVIETLIMDIKEVLKQY